MIMWGGDGVGEKVSPGERVIGGSWGKGFGTVGMWKKNYLLGSRDGALLWQGNWKKRQVGFKGWGALIGFS